MEVILTPIPYALFPKPEPKIRTRQAEEKLRKKEEKEQADMQKQLDKASPKPSTLFTAKSKVVVQSTLPTPRPNRFTRTLPPRGSRDTLRLVEGNAVPNKGARHCSGFSRKLTGMYHEI